MENENMIHKEDELKDPEVIISPRGDKLMVKKIVKTIGGTIVSVETYTEPNDNFPQKNDWDPGQAIDSADIDSPSETLTSDEDWDDTKSD